MAASAGSLECTIARYWDFELIVRLMGSLATAGEEKSALEMAKDVVVSLVSSLLHLLR